MTTLHTPLVCDRLIINVAVAYQAIKLQSYYLHAALHMFLRRMCDICTANRSCYEHAAIFLNMFKKIAMPLQTLKNEAIVQRNCYGSFQCCDVCVAFFANGDTPYVRKPICKGVRAVLWLLRRSLDFFSKSIFYGAIATCLIQQNLEKLSENLRKM